MATTKKKDDEFSFILAGCGIFTVVLIIADLFWAKWAHMEVWVIGLIVLFNVLTAWGWVKIFANWKDPNFDWWRKLVIVTAIAGTIVILGHRGDWIGKQEFVKTEQS